MSNAAGRKSNPTDAALTAAKEARSTALRKRTVLALFRSPGQRPATATSTRGTTKTTDTGDSRTESTRCQAPSPRSENELVIVLELATIASAAAMIAHTPAARRNPVSLRVSPVTRILPSVDDAVGGPEISTSRCTGARWLRMEASARGHAAHRIKRNGRSQARKRDQMCADIGRWSRALRKPARSV